MLALLFVQRPFMPYPILHAARAKATRDAASNRRLWREQLKDRYLLQERLGNLSARALVLWGSGDQLFDASGAEVLRTHLKDAQVIVLPQVGHLPMMEAPGETSQIYARFLSEAGS